MQPESAAYLWDVRAAGRRVATFTAELTQDSYAGDDLRKSAVERQLEIVGEALNKLRKADPEAADRIPDLSRIIGLRNILVHGYAVVDDTVVWAAATGRLPELLDVVDRLIAELE
jgi:uncharacterized protein with HEPN domain